MQRFMMKCTCSFYVITNGPNPEDLKGIFEFPNGCKACGKQRKFRCPKCGKQIKLLPVKN